LHACCAPCLSGVLFQVAGHSVTAFYCNPNISEDNEYFLRLGELVRYCETEGLSCVEGPRNGDEWQSLVSPLSSLGERSRRCYICYHYRMEQTFLYAKEHRFDAAGTVLSVSPHKSYAWINEIGLALEKKYGVAYYDADFKKNNGFLASVQNSKKFGFYRQSYCGCSWSRIERENRGQEVPLQVNS